MIEENQPLGKSPVINFWNSAAWGGASFTGAEHSASSFSTWLTLVLTGYDRIIRGSQASTSLVPLQYSSSPDRAKDRKYRGKNDGHKVMNG
jgi:hypothetical protein